LNLLALILPLSALVACSSFKKPEAPAAADAVVQPKQVPILIVGTEQKATWDAKGVVVFSEPNTDAVAFYDISDGKRPALLETLPLSNSVFGPPVNIAITPDGSLALISDSITTWQDPKAEKPDAWAMKPATRIHVIDLSGEKPTAIGEVDGGQLMPSGIGISPDGTMALVANRKGKNLTVLKIEGKEVTKTGTVDLGIGEGTNQPAAVTFTPDGRRALVVLHDTAGKIVVVDIGENGEVTHDPSKDMEVGSWVYNVKITPDGKLALTCDIGGGSGGKPDGVEDTVSVIDLTVEPPKVIAQVKVGDAPEGLSISPDGKMAVVGLLNGSNSAHDAAFYHAKGRVVSLSIDSDAKKVVVGNSMEVGGLPEGIQFGPDGKYVYVGNFLTSDVSILAVEGSSLVDTGEVIKLAGRPGSLR
jgi:DNA-binding beta-propeller fold protein YncE